MSGTSVEDTLQRKHSAHDELRITKEEDKDYLLDLFIGNLGFRTPKPEPVVGAGPLRASECGSTSGARAAYSACWGEDTRADSAVGTSEVTRGGPETTPGDAVDGGGVGVGLPTFRPPTSFCLRPSSFLPFVSSAAGSFLFLFWPPSGGVGSEPRRGGSEEKALEIA